VKLLNLWLPVFLWAALIFYLSGIPNLHITTGICDIILRKLAHAGEFFILTFLLYRAFRGAFNLSAWYLFIRPAGLSLLYAVSDEIHQLFVPSRVCSARDVLIDCCGIMLFYIIIRLKKVIFS
jgi:VanZ family protein